MSWIDELIVDFSDNQKISYQEISEILNKIFQEDDPKSQIAVVVRFEKDINKTIHIFQTYEYALNMINLYGTHPEDTEVAVYSITKQNKTLILYMSCYDTDYYRRPNYIRTEELDKNSDSFWRFSRIYKHTYKEDE